MIDERSTLSLFPEALRQARKKVKMTQEELAHRIGTSSMSVRRYESGETLPNLGTLSLICSALNDYSLSQAWADSSRIANGKPDARYYSEYSQKHEVRKRLKEIKSVEDAVDRHYWQDLIQRGSWKFIRMLIETARCYQKMNPQAIEQAIETIRLFSKVPELQADYEWVYDEDNSLKNTNDDQNERESTSTENNI